MTPATLGLTLLAVAEVPNFYSGLLPSLWTIGHFGASEAGEARYWIRRGEVMATGLTAAVAIGTSYIAKSWVPGLAMAAMAVVLLALYEHALRNGAGAGMDASG
jgi:hypothetical protein